MNAAQVNQEWWQHAQGERARQAQRHSLLAAEASKRMSDAYAWLARALPGLADDPFALLATMTLKADDTSRPVTAPMVRSWLVEHATTRHRRGYLNDTELADRLEELA